MLIQGQGILGQNTHTLFNRAFKINNIKLENLFLKMKLILEQSFKF